MQEVDSHIAVQSKSSFLCDSGSYYIRLAEFLQAIFCYAHKFSWARDKRRAAPSSEPPILHAFIYYPQENIIPNFHRMFSEYTLRE